MGETVSFDRKISNDAADEQAAVAATPEAKAARAKLAAEMDDVLEEIDEVLEQNAAEFVRNYVQKGGE